MKALTRIGTRVDTFGGEARMRSFRNGWPATASPGVGFHRTAKVQYRYREAGAGPTIVFTADPPMTLETYDELIATFARAFRVVVVELPAFGLRSRDNWFMADASNSRRPHTSQTQAGKSGTVIRSFPNQV